MAASLLLSNQQTQSKSNLKSASAGSVTRVAEFAANSYNSNTGPTSITLSANRSPERAPVSAFNGGVSPRDREAALEMAAAGSSPSHAASHSPVHWDSDSELSLSMSVAPSPRVVFDAHGNPVPIAAAELAPDIDRAISSSLNSFLFGMCASASASAIHVLFASVLC